MIMNNTYHLYTHGLPYAMHIATTQQSYVLHEVSPEKFEPLMHHPLQKLWTIFATFDNTQCEVVEKQPSVTVYRATTLSEYYAILCQLHRQNIKLATGQDALVAYHDMTHYGENTVVIESEGRAWIGSLQHIQGYNHTVAPPCPLVYRVFLPNAHHYLVMKRTTKDVIRIIHQTLDEYETTLFKNPLAFAITIEEITACAPWAVTHARPYEDQLLYNVVLPTGHVRVETLEGTQWVENPAEPTLFSYQELVEQPFSFEHRQLILP